MAKRVMAQRGAPTAEGYLQPGWREAKDDVRGRTYYYCQTGNHEVSWLKPPVRDALPKLEPLEIITSLLGDGMPPPVEGEGEGEGGEGGEGGDDGDADESAAGPASPVPDPAEAEAEAEFVCYPPSGTNLMAILDDARKKSASAAPPTRSLMRRPGSRPGSAPADDLNGDLVLRCWGGGGHPRLGRGQRFDLGGASARLNR